MVSHTRMESMDQKRVRTYPQGKRVRTMRTMNLMFFAIEPKDKRIKGFHCWLVAESVTQALEIAPEILGKLCGESNIPVLIAIRHPMFEIEYRFPRIGGGYFDRDSNWIYTESE